MKVGNWLKVGTLDLREALFSEKVNGLLIITLFAMALGSYCVIPFYIFYMTKKLGVSSIEVGILLSANVFSQRGLALIVGFLVDIFGSRILMLIGVALRVLSFILLASAHSFELLLVATLLSGLGVAMAQTAGKTLLISDAKNISALLATRTIAINLGAILGPVVGYSLLSWSFPVVCYSVAVVFLFVFIILYIYIPYANQQQAHTITKISYRDFIKLLITPFVFSILLLQACFHFFYTTLEFAFPVYAKDYFNASVVGAIFTVNAVVAVVFQLPVARLMNKNVPFGSVGMALMSLSFIFVGISSSTTSTLSVFYFLLAVVIFSLAEVFVMLFVDVMLAKKISSEQLGKFFGLSSFCAMLGAIFGNNALGYILSLVKDKSDYAMFWFALSLGAGFFLLFFIFSDFVQIRGKARKYPV